MVFLVAEIGVNWHGNYKLAEEMMYAAKNAGCNAVKFQSFTKESISAHPQASKLIETSISESNIRKINEIAESVGIEWFCTPMYKESVELLDPYVKRFKIRFTDGVKILDNNTSDLLKKIIETGKEVIISSNIPPKNTIPYEKIKWLYVVPKYPCELDDLDFSNLGKFDGYSNHSPSIIAPLTAVILGAKIIEVHITADKSKNYIDNNVSLDYSDLNKLSQQIKLSENIKR